MQEVVAAFNDNSEPKKVQMSGLHIAGQKYFVLKADETSIYGKQVGSHPSCPQPRIEAGRRRKDFDTLTTLCCVFTGQRRHRRRQNQASPSHHTLPRIRPARLRHQHRREAGCVPRERWVLKPLHINVLL